MSPTDFAIWVLAGLLAFWLLGGFVARIGGLLLVFAGAASLALDPPSGALALVAIGALVWLAGHWHYALRHRSYKSPLARYVFRRWAPVWLDPTRGWAVPVVDAEPAGPGRRT